MRWTKQTPYSWKREDGAAMVSAAKCSGVVWYSAWVRDASAKWHPVGWRCVAHVTTPDAARSACDGA